MVSVEYAFVFPYLCTFKAHIIASFRAFDSSKNVQKF